MQGLLGSQSALDGSGEADCGAREGRAGGWDTSATYCNAAGC
jgi:hypothetical protein